MNRKNRILFMFMITGIFLFILGCPSSPPKDNQSVSKSDSSDKSDINERTSGLKSPDQDDSSETKTYQAQSKGCTSVTEQDLKDEIPKLPNKLTEQFNNGTISLSYANNELIFKGYVYGNGNNFRALLKEFDKFRSGKCIKTVSFQGATEDTSFEWRPEPNFVSPTPPADCKADIVKEFDKSLVKDQINKNLKYIYNEQTGVLEFDGYVHDLNGKGKFNSLIGQLQRLMTNGCIKKVVFTGGTIKGFKAAMNSDFRWTLCQGGLCECGGVCVACPC